MLRGRRVLLGITGGIAAYKVARLVRLIKKEGGEVKVIMTPAAQQFITPLTMATLSQNPVYGNFFDPTDGRWNSHVSLALWAEAFVIAPATANTLAKMSMGIADNLLTTSYLSARCPVLVAPAMDREMYLHPTTATNLSTLRARGVRVVEPEIGFLASGLEGKGRMAEPETIIQHLRLLFPTDGVLAGKRALVTMGPTREPIDPVRYITNRSSGRMGTALGEALLAKGAEVFCVAGPAAVLPQAHERLQLVKVETAEQMFTACVEEWPNCDAAFMAAAVADYRPAEVAEQKIKRKGDEVTLTLAPNPDIAAALGEKKKPEQLLVGFALESENALEHAKGKIARKRLDLCVVNSLEHVGAGFETLTNVAVLLTPQGVIDERELESKESLAKAIVAWWVDQLA